MRQPLPLPSHRQAGLRVVPPVALLALAALSCVSVGRYVRLAFGGPDDQDGLAARSAAATATAQAEWNEQPALPESGPAAGALESLPSEIPPQGFSEEQIPEGLGGGDVQITLLWIGDADIDLHVIDPFGEEIYFAHDTSASGGYLDHDLIPSCGPSTTQPVENVFWPSGGAPRGHYQVAVVYYSRCDTPDTTPFEVIVRLDGRIYDRRTGSIDEPERLEVLSFDY